MPRNILVIDSPRELPQAELDDCKLRSEIPGFQRMKKLSNAQITWQSNVSGKARVPAS